MKGEVRKRSRVLAGLLAFLCPGLGHLYVGRPWRAVGIAITLFGAVVVGGPLGWFTRFWGMVFLLVLAILLGLGSVVDAVLIAHREREYRLRDINRALVYLLWLAAIWGADVAFELNRDALVGVRFYMIPTQSMVPTLVPGDRILVDLRAYRDADPQRDDVIVFPEGGGTRVCRVIGLPGDVLAMKDGVVSVNWQSLDEPYLREGGRQRGGSLRMDPIEVPEGEIFLMGDFRDRAADSRVFGPVPVRTVIGRVTDLFWSRDRARIGTAIR